MSYFQIVRLSPRYDGRDGICGTNVNPVAGLPHYLTPGLPLALAARMNAAEGDSENVFVVRDERNREVRRPRPAPPPVAAGSNDLPF